MSEYFCSAQLKTLHTAPWPHCPNKNVCSNCLIWPYDSPDCLRLGGRLVVLRRQRSCLQNRCASDWRVFECRQNAVVWHGRRRRADGRRPGDPGRCRTRTGSQESLSWIRRAAAHEASAAIADPRVQMVMMLIIVYHTSYDNRTRMKTPQLLRIPSRWSWWSQAEKAHSQFTCDFRTGRYWLLAMCLHKTRCWLAV